jgi:exopolyphosphatase/guanosine-5'-triphosphate,3'-diphosphate pyrophosphatase
VVQGTTDWAIPHVQQVDRLSHALFDLLRPFHGLGDDEALLLRGGALLHDVGYPIDAARHHKVSSRLIRTYLGPPFRADQVDLIALLARYHRDAIPKLKHRRYARLDARGRRVVTWLGGILRVADGLDRGHDSVVQSLAVVVLGERLEIRVGPGGDVATPPIDATESPALPSAVVEALDVGVQGALRKRSLLERALGMPVAIRVA